MALTTPATAWQKGTYSISIKAHDENNDAISIKTDTTGVVENVDISSSEPMLVVGGQQIPTSQIKSVAAAAENRHGRLKPGLKA